MTASLNDEQRFIAEVEGFRFIAPDMRQATQRLDDWLADLGRDLESGLPASHGMQDTHALARQVDALRAELQAATRAWAAQWAGLAPAQSLADTFEDMLIVLVFGKVNAGKSSLCNFLAGRFAAHGHAARHFHFDAGRIVETAEPFQEGATETTSRIQGVQLGGKLVLLDTPGLHSVEADNGALTRRFTDSADAVLWLSSSTSPGQVQELDELRHELQRGKPLLPVLTRSDVYEEDEIDGEIRKFLRNKTGENRALQEADVEARAQDKLRASGLEVALLQTPVSVSAYVARERGQTPEALQEAGFERLYAALLGIARPALAYKRRKRAEVLLHHLEENVLGALHARLLPQLAELEADAQSTLAWLGQQPARIATAAWRRVVPSLPGLLETHAETRDVEAACRALSDLGREAFEAEARIALADHTVVPPDASHLHITPDEGFAYEEHVIEQAAGRRVVGVSYVNLHAALEATLHQRLLQATSRSVEPCQTSVTRLREQATRLHERLHVHEQRLLGLKAGIRLESAGT